MFRGKTLFYRPRVVGIAWQSLKQNYSSQDHKVVTLKNCLAILQIAARIGVDRSSLETALQSPELKARLKDEVEAALAAGVFGSPHVLIDGEAFFGADRLPQIERWLETGGF